MKITQKMLRKIIAEEIKKSARRKTVTEGSKNRPVKVTPAYINRLIREEHAAFKKQQRIIESRKRRRLAEAKRRRLAEAKRRKDTVYYY